jgi:hypothetical protein
MSSSLIKELAHPPANKNPNKVLTLFAYNRDWNEKGRIMIAFDPLTIGTLLTLASAGQSQLCQMPKPTEINVIPRSAPVKYELNRTMADIQSEHIDTVNPYSHDTQSHTAGFMKGSIGMSHEVQLDTKFLPRYNAYCIWFETVDLKIEIDPTLFIAKEKAQDPCEYRVIKEHELKHVTVDRQIVNKYSATMGRKIYDGLKTRGFMVGPVRAENAQKTITRMQKIIGQLISLEKQKMNIERQERQQAVDSLEEYERVNAACDKNSVTSATRSRRR